MKNKTDLNIWTYWEGPQPDWIGLCLESLRRHNPTARILTPPDLQAMDLPGLRNLDMDHLRICQKSDVIRYALLHEHGGLWVDADCIVFKPLDDLLDIICKLQMITYGGHSAKKTPNRTALMGCLPSDPIVGTALRRAANLVCAGATLRRNVLGPALLSRSCEIGAENSWPSAVIEAGLIQPVLFKNRKKYKEHASDLEHEKHFCPDAWTYMLTNHFPLRHMSRAQIMSSKMFGGFLFRRAMGK